MRAVSRVIFDTSTLISAAIRPGSVPYQALLKAYGTCVVCASQATLCELREVLARDKFARYLDVELREEFVTIFRRKVELFVVENDGQWVVEPICRDAKDMKFLELALVCEADQLISSDFDLLVLHPWRGMPIISPAEFIAQS